MPNSPKPRRPRRVPRERSLAVLAPHLLSQIDSLEWERLALNPEEVGASSHVPVPWAHTSRTGNMHRWWQPPMSRTHMAAGCAICRGYATDERTSLASLRPALAAEWHPTPNGERTPDEVTPGSRHDASWLCTECTYTWVARISSRALDGNGCPRCAGQKALPGDPVTLAVARPELYDELDVDGVRALGLDPLRVHVRSNRRLAWICAQDRAHRWQASPSARMNGCLCPHCPHMGQSSRQERALLALLLERHEDAVGNAPAGHVRWLDRRGRSLPARCDILVPSLRLVVEYDGLAYHHAADRRRADCVKTLALLAAGWRVVRVRERTTSKRLANLDITDKNLLQVQHRYGDPLAPLVDTILAWVQELDG